MQGHFLSVDKGWAFGARHLIVCFDFVDPDPVLFDEVLRRRLESALTTTGEFKIMTHNMAIHASPSVHSSLL